jgi:hypothetical protein
MAALTIDQGGTAAYPGGVRRPKVPSLRLLAVVSGSGRSVLSSGRAQLRMCLGPGGGATPSIMLFVRGKVRFD